MSEIQLKPCPFCGSRDIGELSMDVDGNEYWSVVCKFCGAKIQYADFCHNDPKKDAQEAWNRRVDKS